MLQSRLLDVDVICQFSQEGNIIPLRIRVKDEEGEFHIYTIKGYRDLSHQGEKLMPDGVYVTDRTLVYECKINVFERMKVVRLYYEPAHLSWKMTSA